MNGYKDKQEKPSYREVDPDFLDAIAYRMSSNKGKYDEGNWKKMHDIKDFTDAIQRHLNDINRILAGGADKGESIRDHCAALACNAMFIHYHIVEANEMVQTAESNEHKP